MKPTKRNALSVLAAALLACSAAANAADDFYAKQQIATKFNETMNRCISSGCKNLQEVLSYFAETAVYIDAEAVVHRGRSAISKHLSSLKPEAETSDEIRGLDIVGSAVSLRLDRRKDSFINGVKITRVTPHLQVIVLDGARITRLVSVIPPVRD